MTEILDEAVRTYQPKELFALFSGGHDSLCATHLTAQDPAFAAAVHINTGIGIEQTREFVRETCERQGWPLLELGPPETLDYHMGPEMTYEQMVLKWGFPGPPQHKVMYTRLKERGLRVLRRTYPDAMLATGIRHQESTRRFRNYVSSGTVNRLSGFLWANPIADWDKLAVNEYLDAQGLPRNPVVDLLHMSGECLCGSFAKPGEMAELEQWFPDTAAYLHDLERRTEEAGLIGCVWGRRKDEVNAFQQRLFPILPLCQSCEVRGA